MAFDVSLADMGFTQANFEGQAYADETTGLPMAMQKIVQHVAAAFRMPVAGSLLIGTGAKGGATYRNMPLYTGQPGRLISRANAANFMRGSITAYAPATGGFTISVTSIGGSGTFSDFDFVPEQPATLSLGGLGGVTTAADTDRVAMVVSGADRNMTVADFAGVMSRSMPNKRRNRLINGQMLVDQRGNALAPLVIPAVLAAYPVDRWVGLRGQTAPGSLTMQRVFNPLATGGWMIECKVVAASSQGATDYTGLAQNVEGWDVADLDFGMATAATVTLSFDVLASVAGQYSGSLGNFDGSRAYPFLFTVATANVLQRISLTIPGDTAGTWKADGNVGLTVRFDLGSGANYRAAAGSWQGGNFVGVTGAQNIMGTAGRVLSFGAVQLERGTVATAFEWEPLALTTAGCQRYFQALEWHMNTVLQSQEQFGTGVAYMAGMRGLPTVAVLAENYRVNVGSYNFDGISALSARVLVQAAVMGGPNGVGLGLRLGVSAEI